MVNRCSSLKKNIVFNYASQLYVTGVGILVLPLYIKYMGAEAYGLVGFFTMLQAWFNLLDIGLTPTIGRETARYYGGVMSAVAYRQLFRALSLIFLMIAIMGGGILWLASGMIATDWININALDFSSVVISLKIIAVSVSLRWMGGLFRGVITGSEHLIWLSIFNSLIATLRFLFVFISMWVYGFTPLVFFLHQLAVAGLEIIGLWMMCGKLLPDKRNLDAEIGWSFQPVKSVLKFSLSIAFTSSVWVLVTQTDKLVLSGVLSLTEYGYFSLAVLVANGIMVISGPVSSAVMPRMARLHAEGLHQDLLIIYNNATQLVSVTAGSASIVIAFFAEPLLYAWTGNQELSIQAAPILRLYAIGNGFLAVAAFPYYLQYAIGNLRYHVVGNIMLVIVLIPSIVITASYFGGVGAGYVWAVLNGLFLFTWVGFVHHKLEPGLHYNWLMKNVVLICLPASLFLLIFKFADVNIHSRLSAIFYIAMGGGGALATSIIMSPYVRTLLLNKFWGVK